MPCPACNPCDRHNTPKMPEGYRSLFDTQRTSHLMEFSCPECGSTMEVIGEPPSNLRIGPACGLLQWDEGGKTQTRYPELVKGPAGEGDDKLPN